MLKVLHKPRGGHGPLWPIHGSASAGGGRAEERRDGEMSPVQACQPLLEQEMGVSWQQGPPYLTEIRNLNH